MTRIEARELADKGLYVEIKCTSCKLFLSTKEFYPSKKLGFTYSCRQCNRVNNKKSYFKNHEINKNKKTARSRANKDWQKTYQKQWYKKNKTKKDAQNKAYAKNNPLVLKKATIKYLANHPEKRKAVEIAYWNSPRGKDVRQNCNARRRSRVLGSLGFHTTDEWKCLKDVYNNTCPCCLKKEPDIKLTRDHIIPISKGGSDYIHNIQPLCHSCNSKKNNKSTEYLINGLRHREICF